MNICKPTKNAKSSDITQGFHENHQAIDLAGKYGDFLVSPFNGKVENIIEAAEIGASAFELQRGYGIRIRSVEDPRYTIGYWHCLPVFPVAKGQTVWMGQPIGQMGNSGWVETKRKYVEIDVRTRFPFPGTHCHISFGKDNPDRTTELLDFSKFINWDITVKYDILTAIKVVLQKISNLLLNRK